jgi:hypothetical protein
VGRVHQALCEKVLKPVQVKKRGEHDSKRPKDQSVKVENFEDLDGKC